MLLLKRWKTTSREDDLNRIQLLITRTQLNLLCNSLIELKQFSTFQMQIFFSSCLSMVAQLSLSLAQLSPSLSLLLIVKRIIMIVKVWSRKGQLFMVYKQPLIYSNKMHCLTFDLFLFSLIYMWNVFAIVSSALKVPIPFVMTSYDTLNKES